MPETDRQPLAKDDLDLFVQRAGCALMGEHDFLQQAIAALRELYRGPLREFRGPDSEKPASCGRCPSSATELRSNRPRAPDFRRYRKVVKDLASLRRLGNFCKLDLRLRGEFAKR